MTGIFLTRAPSRSPVVKRFGIVIADGTTEIVDTVSFTARVSVKWLVAVSNATDTEKETYVVIGNYIFGAAAPSYSVYARTGGKIKNSAEVVLSGGDLALEITNTEGVDITVDVLRFDLIV